MDRSFVHLHLHTKYSLHDSSIKAKALAKKLNELGMKYVAITDHGNMFATVEYYKELTANGITPIIGMEAYMAPRYNNQKESKLNDDANYHLVLLCENQDGYKNLMKIASDASINGFYRRPRTDKSKLRQWHNGIIALSACIAGEVQVYLRNDEYDKAKEIALEYDNIFGRGNFYLELQNHGMEEQIKINPMLIKMSNETGIPLICTNDCHYINKEDAAAHDILMAIQSGTNIYDEKRKKYPANEFYVKSSEEMWELFSYIPEAYYNTLEIAKRCKVDFEFGVNKLPPFTAPKEFTDRNYDFLRYLTEDGLKKMYGENVTSNKEIMDRAEYELSVIENMGYTNYFLIVWDFFRFCQTGTKDFDDEPDKNWKPILTGPGRGCFLPESKIILNNFNTKNIEDVEIGDKVISDDGSINKVYTKFKYDVKDEKMVRIKISGEKIECTPEHKILVLKTGNCNNKNMKNVYCTEKCKKYEKCSNRIEQKIIWEEAQNITKGDYLCIPKNINISKLVPLCKFNRNETIIQSKDYLFKKIYDLETFIYTGNVYDLGVEDNPTYNINGFAVHNSGAGSIILYALGITKIDPINYNLVFERFLDPSRISMPDLF